MKNKLIILARSLAIIFIMFVSIFALDSQSLIEFFIQIVPSIILLLILALSWKKTIFGGLYLLVGIVFLFFFHTYTDIFSFLLISGPPILIGFLFLYTAKIKR